MKKTGRFFAIGCAALLLTAVGLTACTPVTEDDGPITTEEKLDPIIPGNYAVPSAKDVLAAFSDLDISKIFGDTTEESYHFSLQAEAGIEYSSLDGPRITGETDYALTLEANSMKGMGDLQISVEQDDGTETVSGDYYNDNSYVYFDFIQGDDTLRGKLTYEELLVLSGLDAVLPQIRSVQPLIAPSDEELQIREMLAGFEEAGIAVGLDAEQGVRMKFSANEDFFRLLEENMKGDIGSMQVNFTKKTLDIYFRLSEEGVFEQFSVVIDIGYDASSLGEKTGMSVSGQFVIAQDEQEVTLPDDLTDENTYPSYVPSSTSGDGILTTFLYPTANVTETVYDAATDTVTTISGNTFIVRDAQTGTVLERTPLAATITCADAYGGTLCLGLGDMEQIHVVDLSSMQGKRLTVGTPVYDLVVMKDCIVYCESSFICEIYRCDFDGNNRSFTCANSFSYPILAPDRDHNIVYAAETGSGMTDLFYIYLDSGTALSTIDFNSHFNNEEPVRYDGIYVHFDGACYDVATGKKVSYTHLAEDYPSLPDDTPAETLYITERYSFVKSLAGNLLIFDRDAKTFVYSCDFAPSTVYAREDGTFFVVGAQNGYAAIIDPSRI